MDLAAASNSCTQDLNKKTENHNNDKNDDDSSKNRNDSNNNDNNNSSSSVSASADDVRSNDESNLYSGKGGVVLTEEEMKRVLSMDTKLVSDFWRSRYENDSQRNWDIFYKLNKQNFFKDRHYLDREFAELNTTEAITVLEVGCGVGNTIFPLLELNPKAFVHACDFSPRAVEFVKSNEAYQCGRCNAFCADLTKDALVSNVPAASVDVVLIIFVLSTIHPDKMLHAVQNIAQVLKPGGCVLFRDYGLYDMAQLKYGKGKKLDAERPFYVRPDGTRTFFFSEDDVRRLFGSAGLEEVDVQMYKKVIMNRKEGAEMHRKWIQARYKKPLQ